MPGSDSSGIHKRMDEADGSATHLERLRRVLPSTPSCEPPGVASPPLHSVHRAPFQHSHTRVPLFQEEGVNRDKPHTSTSSTMRRVSDAMPLMRCRKLSATRSATRIDLRQGA